MFERFCSFEEQDKDPGMKVFQFCQRPENDEFIFLATIFKSKKKLLERKV